MCEMIVKQLYIFVWEGTIEQFCNKLRDFLWYICPAKDEPWKVLLQSGLKLQSIPQNVNQVLQM